MDEILNSILDLLLKALVILLPVLFTLLTRSVMQYLKKQEAKLVSENRIFEADFLRGATRIAIAAADELYDDNEAKKSYATVQLLRIASNNGIDLDYADTSALIEGSIKSVKTELKWWTNGTSTS